jgi:hypothetical protein
MAHTLLYAAQTALYAVFGLTVVWIVLVYVERFIEDVLL